MKDKICPICLSKKICFISNVAIKGTDKTKPLIKCENCEKIFWDDTKEEECLITNFCENSGILKSCKANAFQQGFVNTPEKRTKELDKICCDCPDKKFVLQPK